MNMSERGNLHKDIDNDNPKLLAESTRTYTRIYDGGCLMTMSATVSIRRVLCSPFIRLAVQCTRSVAVTQRWRLNRRVHDGREAIAIGAAKAYAETKEIAPMA